MNGEPTVTARRDGRAGRIMLNRPRALNALDHGMVQAVGEALHAWREDPAVHAVVIEGAGGRAFCAGGDIRAVRAESLAGRYDEVEAFFAAEYAVNHAIADYPKPYVALIDGICMGGGIGLSVHGSARVTTEAAVFAMPETGIALFPDIGATYLLPRLRGKLGMYLALTGARLDGADAAFAGLATHFTDRTTITTLGDAIAAEGVAVLANINRPFSSAIASDMDAIDRCFGAPTLTGIVERLEETGTDWSRRTLTTLRSVSPSALTWTFHIVSSGAERTLPQALAAELALTRHVTRHPDFAEGVRAMIIDKDRLPRWSPPTLAEVDSGLIETMFG